MPKLTSLLKSICGKIMAIPMRITKKMYRQAALLTVGAVVVSVVVFSSNGFAGSGRNAVSTNVVNSAEDEQAEDGDAEESDSVLEKTELNTIVSEDELQSSSDNSATDSNADKKEKRDTAVARIEQKESADEKMVRLLEERRQALSLPSLTVEDYNNLLRIVEAEVGDNDVYGRTIVANVVINRVRSDKFENTITDVIFSPRQFSPIRDGRFYKVKVSEETVEGVNRALMGEDHSRGALYFMDRAYSTNYAVGWFDSALTYLFSYGGHEYFK